ncbi:MAG: NTP transferase domain-containing protein [Candidatus Woesebacteria bacterium]|jgi:choline kinase
MKAVILLAGKGRRLTNFDKPKSLYSFYGKTLLSYLVDGLIDAGIKDIVPVVGFQADLILDFFKKNYPKLSIQPVYNHCYEYSNNLYSLCLAHYLVANDRFLLATGDLMVNPKIIQSMIKTKNSCIMIDDLRKQEIIDSPGTLVKRDRILDLGRHIPLKKNAGYAIGLYYFNKILSQAFFNQANELLKTELNAGFHDPLCKLFNRYRVYPLSTKGLSWTDLDDPEDIPKVKKIINQIQEENKK